jgi:Leucine-rich repeat (LRR) protein
MRDQLYLILAIKEEYTRFGMRMVDLKQFSLALGELNYLLNLTLQGNFIDDEMIDWLVPGLITNHTLRNLDLSNNKITDKG